MDQKLVTHMGVSVVAGLLAGASCVVGGGGLLLGLGAYCLGGSVTLTTLAVARAYGPQLRADDPVAVERSDEKGQRAYA